MALGQLRGSSGLADKTSARNAQELGHPRLRFGLRKSRSKAADRSVRSTPRDNILTIDFAPEAYNFWQRLFPWGLSMKTLLALACVVLISSLSLSLPAYAQAGSRGGSQNSTGAYHPQPQTDDVP